MANLITRSVPCGAREAPEIGFFFADAHRVIHGERTLSEPQRRHLAHLYDSDVRFLDGELGRLFDALEQPPFARNTLLAVTADHGEEFWEHGGYEHGHSVHEEVTRVPLLLHWPERIEDRTVVSTPVSLLDLMPTILRAIMAESPPSQGRPLPLAGEPLARDPVLSENILYGSEQKAARDAEHSVVFDPADGSIRVYDRRKDPEETASLDPGKGARLLRWIEETLARNRELRVALGLAEEGVELSEFQREQLRALGYLVD